MATLLKGTQLDSGVLLGQVPTVSDALKFTVNLAPNANANLTLPSGTDPTLLIVNACVLDTVSAVGDASYNMWIPGDASVMVCKNSTTVTLINKTPNAIQCLVVLR